jgi:dTDP-glucose 4,6-dehydratase/UDP-glucuronate decarboxylase
VVRSDGRVTRSFCYSADFVTAALLLLLDGAPGEAYNVGNDAEVTIAELAEAVADLAGGVDVRYEASDDPAYLVDNPSRRAPDLKKTKATIPWEPVVALRTGLEKTLSYYREGGVG